MTGSTLREVEGGTDPIVDGGVYQHKSTEGEVITGCIMGTSIDPTSKKPQGNLYVYSRGNIPTQVVEDTESMAGWTLVAAPSGKAAQTLKGLKKSKTTREE